MVRRQGQGRKPKPSTIIDRMRDHGLGETVKHRLPAAPGHLNDLAKAEWKVMTRLLQNAGLLSNLDRDALAIYCTFYAQYLAAEAKLNQQGLVLTRHRRIQVRSPYVSILNQAAAHMTRLLAEFSLTPTSRARLPNRQGTERRSRRASDASPQMEDPRAILSFNVQAGKN